VVPVDVACLLSWWAEVRNILIAASGHGAREATLLGQTMDLAVKRQQQYARSVDAMGDFPSRPMPHATRNFTYQFRVWCSWRVKRGLSANHVVSPYRRELAGWLTPAGDQPTTCTGGYGAQRRYGYYEAIIFTRHRLRKGQA